ncbi:uncharacterized protein LOC126898653 [Daktulosphaira vitifoliae]|uniref:uncharacterized protein LOC126898653 n=1 Tax=Daktulosphaira vitifoliae TaxID=58002 RepID=UPI0021AA6F05|nr:uncharacterized protein LOC126898653 [Daktulosphaira vitifoliae]
MQGAMEALDILHHIPLATFKINRQIYIMSILLEKIGNIFDELNDPSDDRSTNYPKFETVYLFSKRIITELQYDTNKYCEFVPYNTNYLWNKWAQEYKTIIDQGLKLVFFKFLTKKIEVYIKTEIIEKYFQLGFMFDPITEETFLPIPDEPIELELEFKTISEDPPMPIRI